MMISAPCIVVIFGTVIVAVTAVDIFITAVPAFGHP
jgi:hypothetical protein